MNSLRGEIRKNKSLLSIFVKQWLQSQHQVFTYFGLWILSLKQVFLSRIRFILLIMCRAKFLSILQKGPKEENTIFSISLFLCKEHSLRTFLRDYTGVISIPFVCLFTHAYNIEAGEHKYQWERRISYFLHRMLEKPLLQKKD